MRNSRRAGYVAFIPVAVGVRFVSDAELLWTTSGKTSEKQLAFLDVMTTQSPTG
jgi:hypothetical protein